MNLDKLQDKYPYLFKFLDINANEKEIARFGFHSSLETLPVAITKSKNKRTVANRRRKK